MAAYDDVDNVDVDSRESHLAFSQGSLNKITLYRKKFSVITSLCKTFALAIDPLTLVLWFG